MKSTKNTSGKMLRKVGSDHRTILTNDANTFLTFKRNLPARVYACSYKSPVENRPKWLYRLSCPETNMFATSVKSKSSVISLCDVNIANEINLFCFMVACSHVFTLCIIENDAQLSQLLVPLLAKA